MGMSAIPINKVIINKNAYIKMFRFSKHLIWISIAIHKKGAVITTTIGVNIIKSIKQINLHINNLTYEKFFC